MSAARSERDRAALEPQEYVSLARRWLAWQLDLVVAVMGGALLAAVVITLWAGLTTTQEAWVAVGSIALVGWLNEVGLTLARGGSVGKLVRGIRVRLVRPPALGVVWLTLRLLTKVPFMLFGVSQLFALFSRRRRALHDLLAGTIVVNR